MKREENQNETPIHLRELAFRFGAAKQIRTADLVITNDVLYHLSYSSIFYAADFHLRHNGDREGARTLDLQRDRLAY